MSRTVRVAPTRATAWLLVVACALLGLTVVACSGGDARADFDDRSARDLRTALDRGGLTVCHTDHDADGFANQATATTVLMVAIDCDDEQVRLIADRFDDVDDRDAAARNFEAQHRPRGDGAVWTWGPFTLFANGARDDAAMDRLTDVLDDAGAR